MDAQETTRDTKDDEETIKRHRRTTLKELNSEDNNALNKATLDSSLKRHTAFIRRARLSIGVENRDQLLKDIDTLTLEKYVEEIAGAVIEGLARCKTEKDVWAATEVISALHRRLRSTFTPKLIGLLTQALAPPPRGSSSTVPADIQEKEVSARIARQRPVIRVCAELSLVGIIGDAGKSGGEWMMKALKDLLSFDPSLSSMPLLVVFLKSYGRPFLGLSSSANTGQVSAATESGTLAAATEKQANSSQNAISESEELIEKDIRDRFKKMCEGYFENVSKLLLKEHNRLQEQDRRNHEAYIRSGEIFEDRQQAYEKMTKNYEKLLSSCQTLSELLQLPMPHLPSNTSKGDSIGVSSNNKSREDSEIIMGRGSQWEDEEERKFYENIIDLKDYIPRALLNLEAIDESEALPETNLSEDMEALLDANEDEDDINDDPPPDISAEAVPEPEAVVAPGPSQVLSSIIARLPDATNVALIDQAAINFAYVNTKAARKRLVKFLLTSPSKRLDLLPYYGRFVATISKYTPDLGKDLLSELESEFKYHHRKKKMVKELASLRAKNIGYFAALAKFKIVPTHLILHLFRVFIDDLTGVNVDNLANLLEGCGRYLLRGPETGEKMKAMLEVLKRKQTAQHFDQRQLILLENAYYQCNPPQQGQMVHKERSPMEQFIRYVLCDVISRKTLDKCFRFLRKLHWEDPEVVRLVFKMFSRPWKIAFGNITLLAMLTYDLQRYHPDFSIKVVDTVLENIRRGMEQNIYRDNQKRVATIKYLGELYVYRMVNSRVIFDTLWSLVTFGHNDGRPLPGVASPLDMPDDYFRIRLVCTLLDSCGMCFDRGSHKRKLDRFITFFQLYILTKNSLPMDVDFMLTDTIENLRPKLVMVKTFEEAAATVDEMFESIRPGADDSGDESGEDEERRDITEEGENDTDADETLTERGESPDRLVLLDAQKQSGPSEDEVAEFDKEFSRMLSDAAADAKKVDRKAALSVWDSTAVPGTTGIMKRKKYEDDEEPKDVPTDVMKFTVLTKRAHKNPARELAVPISSALAAHTRSAQLQDKKEQEQLKRLVLDYEHREEQAELKAMEASFRSQGVRLRFG